MSKKPKQVRIGVRTEAQIKQEVAAWRAAERGEARAASAINIYFADVDTLFKTLTTRRFALLHELRHRGPLSIRALADVLKRDYKNVHTDVNALAHIGLIETTEDRRFSVPWDRIATEIELAA